VAAIADLPWDDRFVRSVPGVTDVSAGSRQLPGVCYARVSPTPVAAPTLVAWSDDAAALLGVTRESDPELAAVLGGNRVLPGMRPFALGYGGHQFGTWAGQLGDGRALTLGEVIGPGGQSWEVQLKGAGPTPYSRRADGRAVLRSSIREFLCSEAMHYLGVPTTRALGLVTTGDRVVRDMFYDGRPRDELGAIVTRIAPTFVRFGNFQLHAWREEPALLRQLADHVITRHFPELGPPSPATYRRWFDEICRRTAVMIAHWMRVGFVHGVMNTDNMSILGLTLDYGPYGWLDNFDADFTPNTTDFANGRYRFGNQPGIAQWNLSHLGRALVGLVDEPAGLASGLATYRVTFERTYRTLMLGKLGLTWGLCEDGEQDDQRLRDVMALLARVETDYSIAFRCLGAIDLTDAATRSDAALVAPLLPAFYREPTPDTVEAWAAWLRPYAIRAGREPGGLPARASRMNALNPAIVLRNYIVQRAIDAADGGDFAPVTRLLTAARQPYHPSDEFHDLIARRPEWARNAPGCSALSCSS
jgi:serine/tyrosine/threonine adenylyltransferase